MATPTPRCERCDDTGIDPDHYAEEQYGDGLTRYLAEPCHDCQLTADPTATEEPSR